MTKNCMASNEATRGDNYQDGKSATSKDLLELKALSVQKEKIEQAYHQIFPKVDPFLVHDLYLRLQEDPTSKGHMYTVEVFTKEGTDSEASRRHILTTTGMAPAIYDKGTHYVTHMRLTPEILKKLNDFDNVLEIMGDYTSTDASVGPRHNLGDFRKRYEDDSREKNIS
jgi:hypothetical protein